MIISNPALQKLNLKIVLIFFMLTFYSCENEESKTKETTKGFECNWARKLTGISNEDEIDGIASDAFENVIVTGKFENTLTIEGQSTTLTSAGMADIMVVKYSKEGNVLWTKQFGGTGEDNMFDAQCDNQGNIILSGYFQNTVQFDAYTVTSNGGLDMIIVKLNPNGNVIWLKQIGGTGDEGANEVAIGINNQIIIGAQSNNNFTVNEINYNNTGAQDAYVISISTLGDIEWIRAVEGSGYARAKAIAVDKIGNVYFGGDFFGQNAPTGANAFTSNGGSDAFMTSWNSLGQFRWSKTWGGIGNDLCKGIVVNSLLDVYMVGQFEKAVNFDGNSLTSQNQKDLFLWKTSSNGNSIWLRHIASADDLIGAEVEIDSSDGVIFGFGTNSSVSIQNSSNNFKQINLPSSGKYPVLVRYDSQGKLITSIVSDSSISARFDEISVSNNKVFIDLVYFSGPTVFGNCTITGVANNKNGAIVSFTMQ
jgi:hypothetical protein